ncbi:hypothetical protein Tco_1348998 [Tanacetum coccineum]
MAVVERFLVYYLDPCVASRSISAARLNVSTVWAQATVRTWRKEYYINTVGFACKRILVLFEYFMHDCSRKGLFKDVIMKTVDYCLFDVVVGFHRYGYQEKDKSKDRTGQSRARDRKEWEKTSPTVPSDIIGPTHYPFKWVGPAY